MRVILGNATRPALLWSMLHPQGKTTIKKTGSRLRWGKILLKCANFGKEKHKVPDVQ